MMLINYTSNFIYIYIYICIHKKVLNKKKNMTGKTNKTIIL